jgi:hypothetical protein
MYESSKTEGTATQTSDRPAESSASQQDVKPPARKRRPKLPENSPYQDSDYFDPSFVDLEDSE